MAPVPTSAGAALGRVDGRFAVARYPYIEGESYLWGEFSTHAHRRTVLDLLLLCTASPATATPHALADDFDIPFRDELASSLDHPARETGPYAQPTSALVVENARRVGTLLARHDELGALVNQGGTAPSRAVLTHGEPHPGNTMLSSDSSKPRDDSLRRWGARAQPDVVGGGDRTPVRLFRGQIRDSDR